MSHRLFCLLPVLLWGVSSVGNAQEVTPRWPAVKPVSEIYHFSDASPAVVNLIIRSVDDTPLYQLRCIPLFEGPHHSIEVLECYLNSPHSDDDPEASLLNEDPLDRAAWHSRGEIRASELAEACGDYPEYGRVRNFRFRGMKLTLKLSQVELISIPNPTPSQRGKPERPLMHAFRQFRLAVKVEPDPNAVSSIAEPPSFARPPYAPKNPSDPDDPVGFSASCETIIPAHVPGVVTEEYVRKEGLGGPYPAIAPVNKSFAIVGTSEPRRFMFPDAPLPSEAMVVYLPIHSVDGKIEYKFECSAYNVPTEEGRIDRHGIVCGLFAHGKKVNLLGDSVDPYSRMTRAQILPDQLYGSCGDYPEWGTLRQFSLRGFHLRLRFSDPVFTQGEFAEHALQRVNLDVKIEPDPTAVAPVALPIKYIYWWFLKPTNTCNKILVIPHKE